MARQIITRDGAELSVETGTGSILVEKCQHVDGKRNAEIFINADHLDNPIRGWLDTHDLNLTGRFKELLERGGRCAYRIEVTRTDKVDPSLPWAEVPQTSRFRRLVGLAMPQNLGQLVGDMNVLASVVAGAQPQAIEAGATQISATPAPEAPSAPAAAPPAPKATGGGNPALCAGCQEPIGTRPCKRVAGGYVHTDTPCLEAPFADTDATAGEAKAAAAEPVRVIPVTEQPSWPAGAAADLAAGAEFEAKAAAAAAAHLEANGMVKCPVCSVAHPADGVEAHEASPVHQGHLRQADQAAELAARRQAQTAEASRFDDAPQRVKLAPVALPAPKGARMMEGRPYERHNSDGSVNMGSYAMQANVAAVNWAQRLLIERVRTVAGETGEQAQIDPDQMRSLARELLRLSDRIQATIRDDGRYDRMDNSHTRARSALATALNVYPVPFGADDEIKGQWREDVVAWAVLIIRMAAELDA